MHAYPSALRKTLKKRPSPTLREPAQRPPSSRQTSVRFRERQQVLGTTPWARSRHSSEGGNFRLWHKSGNSRHTAVRAEAARISRNNGPVSARTTLGKLVAFFGVWF